MHRTLTPHTGSRPSIPPPPLLQAALPWFVAALIAVPVTFLLRAVAQLQAFRYFGISGRMLRHGAVPESLLDIFWNHIARDEWSAAAALFLPSHVGWAIAIGPLLMVAIVLICSNLVTKGSRSRIVLAMAVAAAAPSVYFVLATLFSLGFSPTLDEVRLSRLSGIPPLAMLAAHVLLIATAWTLPLFALSERERKPVGLGLAAGVLVGMIVSELILAPWLFN
ncbi:MAG: hypothetical protein M3081_10325 [Gemmatimonadota bacterium]|nr:hypothetical protein [Gemmatimonadota bacterium]